MAESVTSMPGGVVLEHYTPPAFRLGDSRMEFTFNPHVSTSQMSPLELSSSERHALTKAIDHTFDDYYI